MSYAANRYQSSNYGRRSTRRDELVTHEPIQHPSKGRPRQKRQKQARKQIIARACNDIVTTVRKRHGGILYAANRKDAIGRLFKETRHSRQIIKSALGQLIRAKVLIELDYGIELTTA